MNRTIVFRCAFGGSDGWGHVTRCSALARAFRAAGWRSVLWSKGDAASLPEETRGAFDQVSTECKVESSVLLIDEMYTSDEVLAKVADAYRQNGDRRVVVGIDDMQRRKMRAFDLVINTEVGLSSARYESGSCLLGEQYALLRQGFALAEGCTGGDVGALRVFVMLGGTDAFSYTDRVLECLANWNAAAVVPVVALGGSVSCSDKMDLQLGRFRDCEVVRGLDSVALGRLIASCRFGVIGCGTSVYEFASLGVPFVGLSLVDNQQATGRQIESMWGMPIVFREDRHEEPLELESAFERVNPMGKKAYSKVDTRGAERVCDAICSLVGRKR